MVGKLLSFHIAAATLALPLVATASQIEEDEKKLAAKYAIPQAESLTAKAKGLCACLDVGAGDSLGLITFKREPVALNSIIAVRCVRHSYADSTGDRESPTICDSWVPLAK